MASDVDTGYKTCRHFHGDPACIHAGIIYTWIYHSVSDHAVRVHTVWRDPRTVKEENKLKTVDF